MRTTYRLRGRRCKKVSKFPTTSRFALCKDESTGSPDTCVHGSIPRARNASARLSPGFFIKVSGWEGEDRENDKLGGMEKIDALLGGASSLEEHYARLIGVEAPWRVSKVVLDPERRRVDVWVEYGREPLRCPVCGAVAPGYDKAPERVWRHLNVCLHTMYLHCRLPRCRCAEHGVRRLRAPWEGGCPHFTELFSRHVVDVLLVAASLSAACGLLGISWGQARKICEWAVRVAKAKVGKEEAGCHVLIGIDEKQFGKGQDYVTLVYSHTTRSVLEVVRGKTTEAAAHALRRAIPETARGKIQGVSLDFSAAYGKAAAQVFPKAHQVVDRFHAAALLGDAVDAVRRQTLRRPSCPDALKGTRLLWLKDPKRFTEEEAARFDALIEGDLPICEAWHVKHAFRFFYEQRSREESLKFFRVWLRWALRPRLCALTRVARTFLRNAARLANTYRFGGLTNASAEGFNSKIQAIKASARGFRNFANYRFAILFHCGALPHPTH